MNKRIRKKHKKYPTEFIKNALRTTIHLRVYPILGDLPNDGMKQLNMIRNLRRGNSYTWQREKHHTPINIKIQMSTDYGCCGCDYRLDPYEVLFKRPITMLGLFLKERKSRKERILNLKRKHIELMNQNSSKTIQRI